MVSNILRPLYYSGYRAVVVIFATILQQDNLLSTSNSGESRGHCHRQLGLLNEIFSEFDLVTTNFLNISLLYKFIYVFVLF